MVMVELAWKSLPLKLIMSPPAPAVKLKAPPMVTSGVRLGTPAGTTRGFGAAEWKEIGKLILETLDGLKANGPEGNAAVEKAVRAKVKVLCDRFPIYSDVL